jgi:hypothetical protein
MNFSLKKNKTKSLIPTTKISHAPPDFHIFQVKDKVIPLTKKIGHPQQHNASNIHNKIKKKKITWAILSFINTMQQENRKQIQ